MYDLERFKKAQAGGSYEQAMNELAQGRKSGHWMWFIFPQLVGLGFSPTAQFYAIKSLDEGRQYLADTTLGGRLREACQILLDLPQSDPHAIFGSPDDLKLRSSMTLFDHLSPDDIFSLVLDKYYGGEADGKSLELLAEMEERSPNG